MNWKMRKNTVNTLMHSGIHQSLMILQLMRMDFQRNIWQRQEDIMKRKSSQANQKSCQLKINNPWPK